MSRRQDEGQEERDPRYPLTGTIGKYDVRRAGKNDGEYVAFELLRPGRDPQRCLAFDEKADAVLNLIDDRVETVRLFGFFQKREYMDESTGEFRTASHFRVLWAGLPREEDAKGRTGRPREGRSDRNARRDAPRREEPRRDDRPRDEPRRSERSGRDDRDARREPARGHREDERRSSSPSRDDRNGRDRGEERPRREAERPRSSGRSDGGDWWPANAR
jgi:hypothetical protein